MAVINYGSGWRKDVLNQCLEFDSQHRFPASSSRSLTPQIAFQRLPQGVWLPKSLSSVFLKEFDSQNRFPASSSRSLTPKIAFQHLPQDCQNYLRAAAHGRCQRAPKGLDTANKTVEATWRLSTHLNITRPPWVGNKSSVSIQTMFGFICATSINVGGR